MSPYSVVLITVPDAKTAELISKRLVERRLAACVNQVPGLQSRYRWKGKIETARELLLIAKTRTAAVSQLTQAVKDLHPYEVPEIIALPIGSGSRPYLDWIGAGTAVTAPPELTAGQ